VSEDSGILANTAETESQANPGLTKAKHTIKQLWAELEAAEDHLTHTEARAMTTEQRFAAAGELVAHRFADK
jgi:hypothetical protein